MTIVKKLILIVASAWDLTSLKFLDQYNLKFNKLLRTYNKRRFYYRGCKKKNILYIDWNVEYHHIDMQ